MTLIPHPKVSAERGVLNIYQAGCAKEIAVLQYNPNGPNMMLPGTVTRVAMDLGEYGNRGVVVDYSKLPEPHNNISYDYIILSERYAVRMVGNEYNQIPEDIEVSSSIDDAISSIMAELQDKS